MTNIILKGKLCLNKYSIFTPISKIIVFIVILFGTQALAQTPDSKYRVLSGIVVSTTDDKPLVRATIKIKSTNQTTITNENGEFSLNTDRITGILEISFLGYIRKEVAFNNSDKPILINLKKDDQQLEEVEISTGYQTINPERFVGSATKLDSVAFHRQAGVNIMERLNGTVTGMLFNRKNGTSADDIPTIRGVSTINNSESRPLIIVDNFPMDERFEMDNINPNDILDISVLKDAAAASIWGARAGNGVIVITTKKAKYNQKMDVAYNSNIGITGKPDLHAYPNLAIADFIEIERMLFDKGFYTATLNNVSTRPIVSPVIEILNKVKNNALDPVLAEAEITKYKNYDIRDDLEKYIYQQAIKQQHYLSFKGGSQHMNYGLSFGYNQSFANIQQSKSDPQFTVNSTFNLRPLKNLEIQSNLNLVKSTNHAIHSFSISPFPYERLADENGKALATSWQYRTGYLDTVGDGKLLDWQYRPLEELKVADNTTKNQSINLNLGLNYRFLESLTGKVLYNYRTQNSFRKNHNAQETYYTRDLINRFSSIKGDVVTLPIPLGGIMELMDEQTISQQIRGQIDFNKVLKNDHHLSALIAGEAAESNSGKHSNRYYGYDDRYESFGSAMNYDIAYPTYGRIAGTTAKISGGDGVSSSQISRLVSFLANASYTYKTLYTLYSSARRDGSNIFGASTNRKWKPLWSIGGNWNISNEAFFSSTWLNSLRLRSSFGYMGNTTPTPGLTTITYQPNRDALTNLRYALVQTPPNPDLRWETIETLNMGLDFGVFNNRISGSIDHFIKKSTDLIAPMLIDPTVGLERFLMNSANLKSKGTEIKINSRNLEGRVNWNTTFGFSHVKTIVTQITENGYRASDFISDNLNASIGQIAYGISSYRWTGLDPKTGDPQGYLNGEISKDYKGIANDSIQNQVFNGSAKPLLLGFVNNSVNWKNITVSANISYSFDYYYRKPVLSYNSLFSQRIGHIDYYSRWQQEGDENKTTIPSIKYPVDQNRENFYQYAEINVLKGDHIRLRDIRIDYQLNKNTITSLPFQSIQFFVYASNLNIFLWRADKSTNDPDYNFSGGYTRFPPQKTWTAGLNIHF